MYVHICALADLIHAHGASPPCAFGIEDVVELAAAGRYVREAPALVLGKLEPHAEIYRQFIASHQQDTPAVHLVTLRDASVLNQGAVVTANGGLVRESCVPFIRDQVPMFGLERNSLDTFRRTGPSVRRIERPALLVKGAWWRNYGHWLIDEAALLALVRRRSLLPLDTQIIVGAYDDPRMRGVVEETVESINPRYRLLEHPDDECWDFSELHYVTPIHIPPLFKSPEALSDLRDCLLPCPASQKKLQGRYYVQRPSNGRVPVNEQEIIKLCRSHGLQIVRPETLSLRQQINLFRNAELLVGVKGAAFANLLFCSPGATVILLSPADFSDAFYWDVAARLQVSYLEVFGPLVTRHEVTGRNSFLIDLDHLDQALRVVLGSRRDGPGLLTRNDLDRTPHTPPFDTDADRTATVPLQAADTRVAPKCKLESLPDLTGANYLDVLLHFFQTLRPQSYIDIGTLTGDSLRLATCPTIAIDPNFQLEGDVLGSKPSCHLYQMSSDQFFAQNDPTRILGRRVDAAFVDGMHLCEFVLRDFANLERHAHRNSVIFLHDCVPLELLICGREHSQDAVDPRRRGWWEGDVWRVLLALRQWRPDLRITVLDAYPTGLACITNLDPSSKLLTTNYSAIVDAMHTWKLEEIGLLTYQHIVRVEPTAVVDSAEKLARRFRS